MTGRKKNDNYLRQTVAFVLGMIVGGILLSSATVVSKTVIVLLTGLVFYGTLITSFTPLGKIFGGSSRKRSG